MTSRVHSLDTATSPTSTLILWGVVAATMVGVVVWVAWHDRRDQIRREHARLQAQSMSVHPSTMPRVLRDGR